MGIGRGEGKGLRRHARCTAGRQVGTVPVTSSTDRRAPLALTVIGASGGVCHRGLDGCRVSRLPSQRRQLPRVRIRRAPLPCDVLVQRGQLDDLRRERGGELHCERSGVPRDVSGGERCGGVPGERGVHVPGRAMHVRRVRCVRREGHAMARRNELTRWVNAQSTGARQFTSGAHVRWRNTHVFATESLDLSYRRRRVAPPVHAISTCTSTLSPRAHAIPTCTSTLPPRAQAISTCTLTLPRWAHAISTCTPTLLAWARAISTCTLELLPSAHAISTCTPMVPPGAQTVSTCKPMVSAGAHAISSRTHVPSARRTVPARGSTRTTPGAPCRRERARVQLQARRACAREHVSNSRRAVPARETTLTTPGAPCPREGARVQLQAPRAYAREHAYNSRRAVPARETTRTTPGAPCRRERPRVQLQAPRAGARDHAYNSRRAVPARESTRTTPDTTSLRGESARSTPGRTCLREKSAAPREETLTPRSVPPRSRLGRSPAARTSRRSRRYRAPPAPPSPRS